MSESTTSTETDDKDVEAIAPTDGRVTLTIDGDPVACRVRRLKTREFLALLRVITNGLGPMLGQVSIDLSDEEAVQRDLSALLLLALPNAVDEFVEFLRTVVEPVDKRRTATVAAYLIENPEIDDLIPVFEQIATQEKDDLIVLAGKAQAMWSRLKTVYAEK